MQGSAGCFGLYNRAGGQSSWFIVDYKSRKGTQRSVEKLMFATADCDGEEKSSCRSNLESRDMAPSALSGRAPVSRRRSQGNSRLARREIRARLELRIKTKL